MGQTSEAARDRGILSPGPLPHRISQHHQARDSSVMGLLRRDQDRKHVQDRFVHEAGMLFFFLLSRSTDSRKQGSGYENRNRDSGNRKRCKGSRSRHLGSQQQGIRMLDRLLGRHAIRMTSLGHHSRREVLRGYAKQDFFF